jgi:hypothetical protein
VCATKVVAETQTVTELALVSQRLKTAAKEIGVACAETNKAVAAHQHDATKVAYSITAVQVMTQFTEARRVHKHAAAAVNKAGTDLGACIERTAAARQEMQGFTTAASAAQTDAQKYKLQVVGGARAMLVADKELKQRRRAHIQLVVALVEAHTAKQLTIESLTTAQAADAVACKDPASSGTQPVIKCTGRAQQLLPPQLHNLPNLSCLRYHLPRPPRLVPHRLLHHRLYHRLYRLYHRLYQRNGRHHPLT